MPFHVIFAPRTGGASQDCYFSGFVELEQGQSSSVPLANLHAYLDPPDNKDDTVLNWAPSYDTFILRAEVIEGPIPARHALVVHMGRAYYDDSLLDAMPPNDLTELMDDTDGVQYYSFLPLESLDSE